MDKPILKAIVEFKLRFQKTKKISLSRNAPWISTKPGQYKMRKICFISALMVSDETNFVHLFLETPVLKVP